MNVDRVLPVTLTTCDDAAAGEDPEATVEIRVDLSSDPGLEPPPAPPPYSDPARL